jgi:hypothetical protein
MVGSLEREGILFNASERDQSDKSIISRCFSSLLWLIIIALLTRLLLLSDTLGGWDPVQQALALTDYDLINHTPHPPGSPTFHILLRIIQCIVQDPTRSVLFAGVILSVFASIAVWGLSLTLPSYQGQRQPGVAGLFLLFSPALWVNSISGGTVAGDAALAAMVAIFSYRARISRGLTHVIGGAVTLGILLGFRQNANFASLCMVPLWLWSIWPAPNRYRFMSFGILLLTCISWIIPSVYACGGLAQWLDPLLDHFRQANVGGLLFYRSAAALMWIVKNTIVETLKFIGFFWIPAIYAVVHLLKNKEWRQCLEWRFIGWWVLPIILLLLLAPYHVEEYIGVLLPVICFLSAIGIFLMSNRIAGTISRIGILSILKPSIISRAWLWSGIFTIMIFNSVLFVMLNKKHSSAIQFHSVSRQIAQNFKPETTMIITNRLGQRYYVLDIPQYPSVSIENLNYADSSIHGVIFDGTWHPFILDKSSNSLPLQESNIQKIIISNIHIKCPPPLVLEDYGPFRVLDIQGRDFVLHLEDKSITVELI